MDFTALVLCLSVLLCQAEGDVKETLHVKTGTDLLLDVEKPVTLKEDEFMFWNFDTVNIVRLTHTNEIVTHPDHKGRAELSPQNQSLLLKNVQKTDSGEYSAGVFDFTYKVSVKYQVTVVDPVSDVKLEVKQCSSDRSDLTVTCTTLDALLSSTFICENTTCSHEGGEPVPNIPPGASMKVYLKNGSVTCHHSNQVSSKEDTKTTEDLCRKDPGESATSDDASGVYVLIIIIAVIILVVVCGAAAAVYYLCCRKHVTEEVKDPVYADVSVALQRDQHPRLRPRHGAQVESPDVIYSTVAAHRSAPTEPVVKMQPETYYTTMRKTAKS